MLLKFSQIVNWLYAFIYEMNHSKSRLGLPSIVALVMVIDKSWTSLGKHEKSFYTDLKKFVDDCKPLVDRAENIRCPCKSCRLVLWVSIKHLSDHILRHGFDPSYKTWIYHGESDLPPPPPVIDNTRQPQMSDMTACRNDLSYIPLNNEQNEPTQGDIGETSNDLTQAKRNEFEELYAVPTRSCTPVVTIAWKNFDTKYLDFTEEPRNVRLGLAADDFYLFGNLSQSYNMLLVILTTYNMPSWLCMKESSFMLTLLIPDPKSLGKDIDVYLRPLIDNLKDLWAKLDVMHIEKNVLESILNTLLMNDKSKDTAKARQDLKRLSIRSCLWLSQNKNEKCSKPQAAHSFTPEDRKKFCQFIKRVKLPDGFGSNFKHKVTDNETNITGLKSHDLNDMLKAQSKVIDIMCNLELIYPPAFFDIMIHLVIHLPLEAIDGGSIRPQWMYPYERFMRKLKNYFQVFKSQCKSIGLRLVIRIDHQELKKVIWYVLHNSLEIDMYRAKFKSEFPNKYMKEEFPGWFGKQIHQYHVDNDPGDSESSELFALAYGLSQTPISVNSCVVNNVRFTVHSYDERLTTQNNEICSPGPGGEMYYDDDIIDEEDLIPHDLADSNDEGLVNLDIDDGVNMSADVARGHDGDGGSDDRLPPYQIPTGCGVALVTEGTRKPNLGGRRVGRMHTRQETQNLRLKAITNKNDPVPIRFEFGDRETLMPLGDHAAHWANYLGEVVRELPLHYPSWRKMPPERKAGSW
nr:hypothetical protein [Tanacetum cinerariifolium]